jgi:predicted MPP superfamily phosphohydrolase
MALGAAAAATIAACCLYHARYVAPYRPVLERLDLPLPEAGSGLAGLRIGFLSDIHASPFFQPADTERAFRLLLEARPDILLFGGDLVSESPRHLDGLAAILTEAAAAAPLGAFAVLGNHDLFVSGQKVTESLTRAGWSILRNAAIRIDVADASLWVAGLDDSLHGRPDPAKAFASVPPGAMALALWHEPELASRLDGFGAFAQLSGHSHAGQVRLPGIRPAWLPRHGRQYIAGLHRTPGGMLVYTSRGVGVYRPPLRWNCPPEVTLITLTDSREKHR